MKQWFSTCIDPKFFMLHHLVRAVPAVDALLHMVFMQACTTNWLNAEALSRSGARMYVHMELKVCESSMGDIMPRGGTNWWMEASSTRQRELGGSHGSYLVFSHMVRISPGTVKSI